MYLDTTVLAGIGTVLLTVVFMAGFGGFVIWDIKHRKVAAVTEDNETQPKE